MRRYKRYILVALVFTTVLTGCKKWDNHIEVGNQDLNKDLSQAIAENSSLSKFNEYVTKAGLDTLLRSSKTYTVWAPTNDALQSLDPAIVNDMAKLRSFIRNHIANQSHFTRDVSAGVRVPMLNGKHISFLPNKFDDANITSADKYVKNGVLHVIDKSVLVLPNIWDFVNSTGTQYLQNGFIAGLNFDDFDPSLAIIDSISSTTGQPIYHPGTGIVVKNRFNEQVFDLKAEQNQYTYFVIQNAGFTLESDSLKPYFATPSATGTDSLAKWNTVRDLIVPGLYPASALTGLVSKFGVPIPVDPAMIVETHRMSNGIVHIVSSLNVIHANKFKQVIIQGESPNGFLVDRFGNTNYRIRFNPATGQDYADIMISGHGVTTYYSYYRLAQVPSIRYRVFALGVNDFQTGTFAQTIIPKYFVAPSTYTTLASLTHNVPLHTAAGAYNEVLLGEFTVTNYGTLEIQLTCTATNPLVLDYLRLVPLP
jgi:uncharacterized surface protein with fasciclin (FAS1) repeats